MQLATYIGWRLNGLPGAMVVLGLSTAYAAALPFGLRYGIAATLALNAGVALIWSLDAGAI
jgi:chromate transport protein ChrA